MRKKNKTSQKCRPTSDPTLLNQAKKDPLKEKHNPRPSHSGLRRDALQGRDDADGTTNDRSWSKDSRHHVEMANVSSPRECRHSSKKGSKSKSPASLQRRRSRSLTSRSRSQQAHPISPLRSEYAPRRSRSRTRRDRACSPVDDRLRSERSQSRPARRRDISSCQDEVTERHRSSSRRGRSRSRPARSRSPNRALGPSTTKSTKSLSSKSHSEQISRTRVSRHEQCSTPSPLPESQSKRTRSFKQPGKSTTNNTTQQTSRLQLGRTCSKRVSDREESYMHTQRTETTSVGSKNSLMGEAGSFSTSFTRSKEEEPLVLVHARTASVRHKSQLAKGMLGLKKQHTSRDTPSTYQHKETRESSRTDTNETHKELLQLFFQIDNEIEKGIIKEEEVKDLFGKSLQELIDDVLRSVEVDAKTQAAINRRRRIEEKRNELPPYGCLDHLFNMIFPVDSQIHR